MNRPIPEPLADWEREYARAESLRKDIAKVVAIETDEEGWTTFDVADAILTGPLADVIAERDRLRAAVERVGALANELERDAQRQVDQYPADSDVLPAVVGRSWVNACRQFRRAIGGVL